MPQNSCVSLRSPVFGRASLAACALFACALAAIATPGRAAEEIAVGVSWSHFQEERWKIDEASLVAGLREGGARYLSADAQSSAEKQVADLENLVARGADVLVVVAHDPEALGPALASARAAGIPVIGYDRLIDAPGVFYLSFDNRRVGRIQAEQILAVAPRGRFAFIKGSPQDPNTEFVHAGQLDALRPAIDAGRVQVVGNQYVEGWLPEVAAMRDGADPHAKRRRAWTRSCAATTAWPAAWPPRSPRPASPVCRCRARTAIRRR